MITMPDRTTLNEAEQEWLDQIIKMSLTLRQQKKLRDCLICGSATGSSVL